LAETAYTQQQPAGLALAAVLGLADLGDCRLVVEQSAIRNFLLYFFTRRSLKF
jgi:hypothetical protein